MRRGKGVNEEAVPGLLKKKAGYVDVYGILNAKRKNFVVRTNEGCFLVEPRRRRSVLERLGLEDCAIRHYWQADIRQEAAIINGFIRENKWEELTEYWRKRLKTFHDHESQIGTTEKMSRSLHKLCMFIIHRFVEAELLPNYSVVFKIHTCLARARYAHAKVITTKDLVVILCKKRGKTSLCPTCGDKLVNREGMIFRNGAWKAAVKKSKMTKMECPKCSPGKILSLRDRLFQGSYRVD